MALSALQPSFALVAIGKEEEEEEGRRAFGWGGPVALLPLLPVAGRLMLLFDWSISISFFVDVAVADAPAIRSQKEEKKIQKTSITHADRFAPTPPPPPACPG